MQHNAIAPCNTSNNVEKVEYVGEGKHCTALGPGADKGLADAALNPADVLLYGGLEENLVR